MKRPTNASRRAGFTLIEALLVLIISGILLGYAIPAFNGLTQRRNAQNARDAVVWMAARARARAIEQGQVQLLEIDPANHRAWIVRRNTGTALASDTVETINFLNEQKTTLSTAANTKITICYGSRGYAIACSGNSPTANVDVTFTFNDRTAVARVKPLGEIESL